MIINWRKWFRTEKWRLQYGGYLLLASAIALAIIEFNKPTVKSKDDLLFIKGTFEQYNWVRAGRGGSSLTFYLQNYNNRFKIKADFFGIVKKKEFKNISHGKLLVVGIPRVFEKYLNSNCRLFVYSVSDGSKVYLDYNDAIRKHNSILMKIGAGLFLLFGIVALYFGYKWKK